MKRTVFLAALLAATSLTSPAALAANLGRPVYNSPPPQDWSGVYVGLEGGYGWGHQDNGTVPFLLNPNSLEVCDGCSVIGPEFYEFQSNLRENRTGADVILGKAKQKGWLFGGFFGAQKQWGSWVLGIEGDVDAANMKGSVAGSSSVRAGDTFDNTYWGFLNLDHSASLESKINMLASLRGKVGFAPASNWLIYGTGGAAFAHVKNTLTDSQSLQYGDDGEGCPISLISICDATKNFTASAGTTMFGWAAGAGVDWKLPVDAGSAWVFGVEYLHYGFPERTIKFTDNTGVSFAFNAKESVDTVKGRISYLFSIH
ncbi:MAG: outer membrane protein [Alphaproteobacteria bacterium]